MNMESDPRLNDSADFLMRPFSFRKRLNSRTVMIVEIPTKVKKTVPLNRSTMAESSVKIISKKIPFGGD